MIYNKNGLEIISAYDLSGNLLTECYDVNGTDVYESEHIDIETVPEYFREDVTNALTYIDGLDNDYVNYIVVTDSHYDLSKTRNTPKLFNYLYSKGRFDKLIHLGDIVDGGGFNSNGWQYLLEDDWWHFKGHWLFTQGNHDSAWSTSLATLAGYFETTENIRYTIDSKHNIFYYDNPEYKIRIIGSHHYGCKDDTSTLNAYVNAAVQRGYKWMFICHYRIDETSDWVMDAAETYGGFICCLSGHRHTDTFRTVSSGKKTLLDINLEADIQGQVAGMGTNIEQCITLVSINPKAKKVKLYRIGLSRVYDGRQWEYSFE